MSLLTADDPRSDAAIRHGVYLCLTAPPATRDRLRSLGPAVRVVLTRGRFEGEFDTLDGHPQRAVAWLRRMDAFPGAVADEAVAGAEAVVHCAAPDRESVCAARDGLRALLPADVRVRELGGVVRPPAFTGDAMHNFAYAHQLVQRPAEAMPSAFLLPMRKSAAWWSKGWMERHTYFLPCFDEHGRQVADGHALAAAAGLPHLVRRTYRHPSPPAADGEYDFVNYFECARGDEPVFHAVCAALRDTARNPEWAFVVEGPTWQGRRVACWEDLFA